MYTWEGILEKYKVGKVTLGGQSIWEGTLEKYKVSKVTLERQLIWEGILEKYIFLKVPLRNIKLGRLPVRDTNLGR